jgi:hypothetical protein
MLAILSALALSAAPVIRATPPSLSPGAGTYSSSQSVTVTVPPGAEVYCCSGVGCAPQHTAAQRYSAPIAVSSSSELACRTWRFGRRPSLTTRAAYTINTATDWPTLCANEPMRAGTIYVCDCQSGADANCIAGADANPGTSESAPKRTLGAAVTAFNGLPAGGAVALCKGGRWAPGAIGLNNAACQPDPACDTTAERAAGCYPTTTCDLRDYDPRPTWGNGDEGRPTISGAGAQLTASASGNLIANGNGYRVLNIALVGNGSGTGISLNHYVTDFEMCNTLVQAFTFGAYWEWGPGATAAQDCAIGTSGAGQRRFWRGNRWINHSDNAALVEEWHSEWDGNYFSGTPQSCITYNHTVYFANNYCRQEGIRFVNNEVHHGPCASSAVYSSKAGTNFLFENNTVDFAQHGDYATAFDIGVWNGCDTYARNTADTGGRNYNRSWCGWSNVTYRGNRVTYTAGSGRAFMIDGSAKGIVYENNVVTLKDGAFPDQNHATFLLPWRSTAPYDYLIENSVITNPGAVTGTIVRNNTVHLSNVTGYQRIVSTHMRSTARLQVYGNSFTKASGSATMVCVDGAAATVAAYGSNACFAGTFGDASYSGGWITTAPSFVAPASGDYTPQAGSPLVGAGSTATTCSVLGATGQPCSPATAVSGPTWSPTAAAKARDGAPDIGAFER